VPKRYKDDPQLGQWVIRRREFFKNGKMDAERKRRLDEIGFDFNPQKKTNEENWNLKFKRLHTYYFNNGKMEAERKRRLDEIGFDFNPQKKAKEENWNSQFKRLRD
jgi:ribosomal protein S16